MVCWCLMVFHEGVARHGARKHDVAGKRTALLIALTLPPPVLLPKRSMSVPLAVARLEGVSKGFNGPYVFDATKWKHLESFDGNVWSVRLFSSSRYAGGALWTECNRLK